YWYLMGKLKPVAAVTSRHHTVEASLASGADVESLLDRLGLLDPGADTLHIGSGLGRVEEHLRRRVHHCHGVDVSPSMVKRARRLVAHPNVTFEVTDGKDLAVLADGAFDLVYSFLVFQHLPRPQFRRYVGDAWAKLVAGGHLVFQVLVDEEGHHPEPPPSHPYGVRYYTRADVEDVLAAAGFTGVFRTDQQGEPDTGGSEGDVVFVATKPASG
ncbi:MAG: hypothetical protein QOI56_364, partial [Actinomycetota bacterium]|nr:hypothetical protein [Actinomycetota bacterium]